MRILITGACGFVGSTLARLWAQARPDDTIIGIDSLSRPGSELNRRILRDAGIQLLHGDLRAASDVEALPAADWVIDAAANPSVVAGRDGHTSSRQLIEHNLLASVNLLEYCRARGAGFLLLSTSRVYSLAQLAGIEVRSNQGAYHPVEGQEVTGLSSDGIDESFSTESPVSLYGATKRASEQLALEYHEAFGIPVWINRCGVLAGAGQFARQDQGIFSYWIHRWAQRLPLTYIGFEGSGYQVRDCLHPRDLLPLLIRQVETSPRPACPRIVNVSGGMASATSLKACSEWCTGRFGPHVVSSETARRVYDVPWLVLASRRAERLWGWVPATPRDVIFEEIAQHAEAHPEWLRLTAG
jgi:CDP-paratose 2-epimerase